MLKMFVVISLALSISPVLYSGTVITPKSEEYLKNLPSPYLNRFDEYRLQDIQINEDSVTYKYCTKNKCFLTILSKEKRGDKSVGKSKNFFISYEGDISAEQIFPLINAIINNDVEDVFVRTYSQTPKGRFDSSLLPVLYLLIMLIGIAIIISSIEGLNKFIKSLLIKIDKMPIFLYIIFFIAVIIYAAHLRLKGIWLPVVDDGNALRLLYSYSNPLYNLFISSDPRHPGLYFTILKPFLTGSDRPVFIARVVSSIFSVISVGVVGLIIMEKNRLFSLVAMLLLGTNAEYIYRSREITDLSLFVMNSLLSILFLKRATSLNRRRDYYLFFVFLTLSCLSSYAAYINLVAMLLFLFIRKKIKMYILPTALMFLILSPSIIKIFLSLPQEFHTKNMAIIFPNIIWGGTGLIDFVSKAIYNLFAGRYSIIILIVFIVFLLLCYKDIKDEILLILIFVSNMFFFICSLYFRMMPYYMLFFVVSFILLIVSVRISEDSNLFHYLFTLIFSLFVLYGFIIDLADRYEVTYIQSYHLRNDPAIPVQAVKKTDVKEIVIDIENNKNILGFNFFDDPYNVLIKKGCSLRADEMMECLEESSKRRITVLTPTLSIGEGWEERAVERLNALTFEDLFFIYDRNYTNRAVLRWLDKNCRAVLLGEKYFLYRCTQDN